MWQVCCFYVIWLRLPKDGVLESYSKAVMPSWKPVKYFSILLFSDAITYANFLAVLTHNEYPTTTYVNEFGTQRYRC